MLNSRLAFLPQPREIFRVKDPCAKVRGDYIFHGETAVIEDCLVRVNRRAVRSLDDNGLWYGVGNPAKFPFVLPQLLFRPLSVLDVGIGSIPSDHLARLVVQGLYPDEEPAVSSIVAAEARFDFASLPGSY